MKSTGGKNKLAENKMVLRHLADAGKEGRGGLLVWRAVGKMRPHPSPSICGKGWDCRMDSPHSQSTVRGRATGALQPIRGVGGPLRFAHDVAAGPVFCL